MSLFLLFHPRSPLPTFPDSDLELGYPFPSFTVGDVTSGWRYGGHSSFGYDGLQNFRYKAGKTWPVP